VVTNNNGRKWGFIGALCGIAATLLIFLLTFSSTFGGLQQAVNDLSADVDCLAKLPERVASLEATIEFYFLTPIRSAGGVGPDG